VRAAGQPQISHIRFTGTATVNSRTCPANFPSRRRRRLSGNPFLLDIEEASRADFPQSLPGLKPTLPAPLVSRRYPSVERGWATPHVPLTLLPIIPNHPEGNHSDGEPTPPRVLQPAPRLASRDRRSALQLIPCFTSRDPRHALRPATRTVDCVLRFAPRHATSTTPHVPHCIDPNMP
jgi:hypothetical protein